MRVTKKEMLESMLGVKEAKQIKNNTLQVVYKNGNIAIRLHRTDIVTTKPNGNTILNSNGYRTNVTKDRLNEFSKFWIRQVNRKWYVHVTNESEGILFYDGITFDINNNLV